MKKKLIKFSITIGLCALIIKFYANVIPNKIHNKVKAISENCPGVIFKIDKLNWNNQSILLKINYNINKTNTKNYLNSLSEVENLLIKSGINKIKYNYQILSNKSKTKIQNSNIKPLFENKKSKKIKIEKKSITLKNQEKAKLTANFVKLRENQNTKSKIIKYLFKDQIVKIISKSNKKFKILTNKNYWYKIKTSKNEIGWVFGLYLKRTLKKNNISSPLEKNIIYQNLLKKSNLLIKKDLQKYLKIKNIIINAKNVKIKISETKNIIIPFEIKNKTIKWEIEKIIIKKEKKNQSPKEKIEKINKNNNKKVIKKYKLENSLKKINQIDTNKTNNQKIYKTSIEKIKSSKNKIIINTKENKIVNNKTKSTPKSNKSYNLKIIINPYLNKKLSKKDINKIKSLEKIVEYRLLTKDYKRNIKFQRKYNPFLDTIKIKIIDINFKSKKIKYIIERTRLNSQNLIKWKTQNIIFIDEWLIDFNKIGNTNLNYENMGDFYYSEIILSLTKSGNQFKDEIISLANFTVNLLLKQKYI